MYLFALYLALGQLHSPQPVPASRNADIDSYIAKMQQIFREEEKEDQKAQASFAEFREFQADFDRRSALFKRYTREWKIELVKYLHGMADPDPLVRQRAEDAFLEWESRTPKGIDEYDREVEKLRRGLADPDPLVRQRAKVAFNLSQRARSIRK